MDLHTTINFAIKNFKKYLVRKSTLSKKFMKPTIYFLLVMSVN